MAENKFLKELKFRNFLTPEIHRCIQVSMDSWRIDESIIDKRESHKLIEGIAEIILSTSTWKQVVLDAQNIIGFLFAKLNKDFGLMQFITTKIKNIKIIFNFILGRYGKILKPLKFYNSFKRNIRKAESMYKDPDGEILLFAVEPKHKGKGVEEALIEKFLTYSRDRAKSCKKIYLSLNDDNDKKNFEKCGFKLFKTYKDNFLSKFLKKNINSYIYYKEF